MTIVDVAALAGVHPGTVSRALSHPEKVAAATRQRVEAAVRELGFVPNRAARGLITGHTGNVAVIVPDITNPHFASLVRSVERAARGADLQVLLVDTGEHPDEEARAARTLASDVDGFIAVSPRRLHREVGALGGRPATFVNRPVTGHGSVLLRTAPAMAEALDHLASLGHSALAYLDGPKGSWAASERRSAVRRTAGIVGLRVVEFTSSEPTFEAANGLVQDVASAGVTAVVAFNDIMALGVLAGLSRIGIAVPEQMSVFGCDDVAMASMVDPSLSTIHLPSEEAGAIAVRLLDEGPFTVELPGTLVLRESTGRVTRRRASAV